MSMVIFANPDLLFPTSLQGVDGTPRARVLLEGSWGSASDEGAHGRPSVGEMPEARQTGASRALCLSLDETIGPDDGWLDAEAVAWSEQLASPPTKRCPVFLNALGLRYHLVRLFRVVLFFRQYCPPQRGEQVTLVVDAGRAQPGGEHEDYVHIIGSLCRQAGAELTVARKPAMHDRPDSRPPHRTTRGPSRHLLWRRTLAHAIQVAETALSIAQRPAGQPVLLCGNPRLLDPVCHALVRRGATVAWLYEQLAVKSWLRWRRRGVRQIVLDRPASANRREDVNSPTADVPMAHLRTTLSSHAASTARHARGETTFGGVDLRRPIERWLDARLAERGDVQARVVDRLSHELQRWRPRSIVLDQDLTPLARATVAVARELRIPTLVVQHGAFFCRLGAAGPVADRVLAWNEASRRQLIGWGADRGRLIVTGPPHMAHLARLADASQPPVPSVQRRRLLLLDTVPPRDERPDAVELALTSASYSRLLRSIETAAARVGAELIVKPHPRADIAATASSIRRVSGDLASLLPRVDAVLSIGSTAGMEAALAGWPVVQVFPSAARGVPQPDDWGLIGATDDPAELEQLLRAILRGEYADKRREPAVFDPLAAADRIAELALAPPPCSSPISRPVGSASLRQPHPLSLSPPSRQLTASGKAGAA